MARLNISAYAAHRKTKGLPGATRKSVHNALNKGWIRKGRDGLIDRDKADAAWAAQSRPRSDGQSAGSVGAEVTEEQLNLHRARKEKALADKVELDVAVRRGELVERDRVERAWHDLGTLIRERLAALPARLAAQVAHVDDEHQVTLLMRVEVEAVLNELGADAPGISEMS